MANGNQLPQPGGGQRDQTKFIVFENFEKMNTQSIRQSLSEKELAWLENLQPIAGNNLTTVPAVAAAALATISENISTMFYAALDGVDYFVTFTTAGSGYLINIATGAVSQFAPDGTFSAQPDVTTWQASRLLIADSKAGYSTFDGTLFVGQGGVSPNITVTNGGTGYGIAPTVTISGGSGTGATAHAVVQNGSVIQVILDNPGHGYQVGDTLTVTFGTAPGSGATAHVTMTGFPVVVAAGSSIPAFLPALASGPVALTFSGGGGTGAAGYVTIGSLAVRGGMFRAFPDLTGIWLYVARRPLRYSITALCHPTLASARSDTESVATIVLDTGGSAYTAAAPAFRLCPAMAMARVLRLLQQCRVLRHRYGYAIALDASAVTRLFIAVQGVSSRRALLH